ncbi:thioredoxin domain-containing protein [Klebsiella pneumoniae]|uniref:thioredoxin domain-containing protein n=1 Tax=Klebsiella pneumoniae TaxID=573 RepID=UPI000B51A253|nr:thioredoxin domain-containing protein [Klebsiella pneumoniae]
MASKIRRWLRELAVWLLIGAAVSLAVDYFRQPALPQNVSATSLQTLDGRTLDLHAMSQQKPLLLYVWATWCGVCRYTTPSVASLAADSGNVLTVALRSGDNSVARQWDIQVTPTLVVISQGEVKSVTTGWTSGWGMRLRLWLASW